jgi:di/tricarboxylate transporter
MILTLVITAGALVLFIWNRIRMDVVAIMVMSVLILTGLVTPREGVSGFANEATLTVAAMFVLSAGLLRTGAIDALGRWMERHSRGSEHRFLALTIVVVLLASAFINNTPVVVVMIPVVLGIAKRLKTAPSRILMPLSFASQLGGSLTLIGTSTNLIVAGLMVELGLPRPALFEFTLPALILAAIGVMYLLIAARWLVPERASGEDLLAGYQLREYASTLEVQEGSPLVGRSLGEIRFANRYGLQIIAIQRGDRRLAAPGADAVLHRGDVLVVRGNTSDLTSLLASEHLVLKEAEELRTDEDGGDRLAEMIVLPRSSLIGRTLSDSQFRTRYGVAVLGIQRHGVALTDKLAKVELQAGDMLLMQGTSEQLMSLHKSSMLALLGAVNIPARRTRKMPVAVAVMAGVVLLGAFEVLPILVLALIGTVAMFLTGCLTPEEAYSEVDWMVLVLLGSLIPLGIAMQNTGAAAMLANGLVMLVRPLGPYGVLLAVYLLASLLTEVISNNAAAVVLTPLAVATASALGASPLPFVVAVMLAASNSFLTPIGYQTNTFIYGPGGYRFGDFLPVGGPLSVILAVAAVFVIPVFFPL